MKTIESALREELRELEKIIKETEIRLQTAPEGKLRIAKKQDDIEYYYKSNEVNNSNGRYMKKNEKSLVSRIAQRDYDSSLMKNAKKRAKAIETFLRQYKSTSLKEIYEKTNLYRRQLICAPIISDEEFVKQWQNIEYKGKVFEDDAHEIITEKGERVRSKSEKIIADKLYALGIPYHYEHPLILEGNVKMYPDFTILKMPERKEIYLEHLGMMDDYNYIDSVIYKLNSYERNGIYIGVDLFLTYETSKKTLNTKALNDFLKRLLYVNM